MVSKNARTSDQTDGDYQISPEEEAKLNRDLGLSDSAIGGSILKRDGGRLYSDDQLRDIVSFDDFLTALGDDVLMSEDFLGSGSEVLRKDELLRLVGTPLLILQWNFTESQEHDSWFVYVEIIDNNNRRYSFASGAKFGIRDQLFELSARTEKFENLLCKKGLDHRTYPYTAEDGKVTTVSVFSIAR
jgi:hypothetical protein